MLVKRIIHPVGFGAFCTEQFIDRDRNIVLNVVYDCGSRSLDTKSLQQEIENTEGLDKGIDLLFISHFHNDHINGIHNVLLKKGQTYIRKGKTHVILPLLSQHYIYEKLQTDPAYMANYISFIIDSMTDGEHEAQYDLSLISITGENPSEEVYDVTIGEDGVSRNLPSRLNGKIVLHDNRNNLDIWEYIPFNFASDDEVEQFEQKAEEEAIELYNIISGDITKADITRLKEIYRSIKGKDTDGNTPKTADINKQSTLLLSRIAHHMLHNIGVKVYGVQGLGCCDICCCHCHLECSCNCSSCLYTGDSYLMGHILDRLSNVLHRQGVDSSSPLGLLQIPHHGSENSSDSGLIELGLACRVFINNVYRRKSSRHPQISRDIMEACTERGILVRVVSKLPFSRLTMQVCLYY